MATLGYDDERARCKGLRDAGGELAAAARGRVRQADPPAGSLVDAEPPLNLRSHLETRRLVEEPSPLQRGPYKRRKDLLDAQTVESVKEDIEWTKTRK